MTLVVDLAYNNMTTQHVGNQDVQIPIDWSTINPLPDLVITKVSEWGSVDPSFAANWHGAAARGALRAAYHYYHNGNLWYTSGRQAKFFSQTVLAQGINLADVFILDNEEKDSKSNPKVSISESLDWFYNVQQLLGLRDYSRFLLYSTADILNNLDLAKLNGAQLSILKQIPVWIAGYPDTPPTGGDLLSLPKAYQPNNSFGDVVLWQYAGEVPNISNIPGGTDLDQVVAWYLTMLRNRAASSPATNPQPAPTPTPAPVPAPSPVMVTHTLQIKSDGSYQEVQS